VMTLPTAADRSTDGRHSAPEPPRWSAPPESGTRGRTWKGKTITIKFFLDAAFSIVLQGFSCDRLFKANST